MPCFPYTHRYILEVENIQLSTTETEYCKTIIAISHLGVNMQRPSSADEYISWWNKNYDPKIDQLCKKQYEDARILVKYEFENSAAWRKLIEELYNYESEYRRSHYGYDLLMKTPNDIKFDLKEWNNFISKTWRKNVVEREVWDEKLDENWITPLNWFEKITDIVRTRIVVKYFDGTAFLLDKICNLFREYGYDCVPDWQARFEGYYAAHLNIFTEYELLFGMETQKKKIGVEIQITTQIKDVINILTHKFYERRRANLFTPGSKWQWNYKSGEFAPNYMGHILHYVEGTIMDIRDKEEGNGRKKL
jgi:ppGpp synthetase/RelA/SpoT-type nucleotidyltranferase